MVPVNPIYASALARSGEFFDELGHYMKMPFQAFDFQGATIPLFRDGNIWNSPIELLTATSNFFVALNGVPFNVRDFCLHVHELNGESVMVSDVDSELHAGHGLSEQECVVLEATYFTLPTTHEAYLDSLDHDDRKTIRRLHDRNSYVQVEWTVDGREFWAEMRGFYRQRMMDHFHYPAAWAEQITGTVDLSVRHMARLGTGLVAGLFVDGCQVGVSIFERAHGCVFHYTDITHPKYERNLCRYSIARAIEHAITYGDRFFDVGHLWDDASIGCDFSFKRRYVPRAEKRQHKLLCFTWLTRRGLAYYFSQWVPFKVFAPFYLDGKLVREDCNGLFASVAQLEEHRTLNTEVPCSSQGRGTILTA